MVDPGHELSSIDFEAMIGGPLIAVINAQAQAAMSSVNFIKTVGFKAGTSEDPEKADTGEPIYVTFKYPKEVAPYRPAVGPGDGSLAITLGDGGSGYDPNNPPSVTIDPPPSGGTQAVATATVSADGVVTGITLSNAGKGYTTTPNVTIAAPTSGNTATATVTVNTPAVAAQIQVMKLEVPILTILPIPFIRIEETTIDFKAKITSMEYRQTDSTLKVDASLGATVKYPPLFSIVSAKLKVNTSYQRTSRQGEKVNRTYSLDIHVQALQDEMPAGMERILGILEDATRSQPVVGPEPIKT